MEHFERASLQWLEHLGGGLEHGHESRLPNTNGMFFCNSFLVVRSFVLDIRLKTSEGKTSYNEDWCRRDLGQLMPTRRIYRNLSHCRLAL